MTAWRKHACHYSTKTVWGIVSPVTVHREHRERRWGDRNWGETRVKRRTFTGRRRWSLRPLGTFRQFKPSFFLKNLPTYQYNRLFDSDFSLTWDQSFWIKLRFVLSSSALDSSRAASGSHDANALFATQRGDGGCKVVCFHFKVRNRNLERLTWRSRSEAPLRESRRHPVSRF